MRLISLFMMLILLSAAPAMAQEVTGTVKVIDGNTFELNGTKMRLFGINAPPLEQICKTERKEKEYPCGKLAARALYLLVSGRTVRCLPRHEGGPQPVAAVCYLGRSNINKYMVVQGWALANRAEEPGFIRDEQAAQQVRDGFWKGGRVPPW